MINSLFNSFSWRVLFGKINSSILKSWLAQHKTVFLFFFYFFKIAKAVRDSLVRKKSSKIHLEKAESYSRHMKLCDALAPRPLMLDIARPNTKKIIVCDNFSCDRWSVVLWQDTFNDHALKTTLQATISKYWVLMFCEME